MTARKLLRIASVGLVLGVSALVVWQWRARPPEENGAQAPPPPASTEGEESDVQSRTQGLAFTRTVNGRPRYRLQAREHLGFEDGRNAWRGGVALILYPEDVEGEEDAVRVTGEEMTTRGSEGTPEEVEVHGNVHVELPSGATVEAERLRYRSSARRVVSRSPVVLHIGDLRVHGRRMEYDTADGRLRIEDELRLAGAGNDDGGSPPLEGRASALLTGDEPHRLRLRGPAAIDVGQARIRAREMVVVLDRETSDLRAIEARGAATARWLSAAERGTAPSVEPGEGGDDEASAGSPLLMAREILVELPDGDAPVVSATTVEDERPGMRAGTAGLFEADRIELSEEPDSGERRVDADGEAVWRPGDGGFGFHRLEAAGLSLVLGPQGSDSLVAEGGVEAPLEVGRAGEGGRVTGERFRLDWSDGELEDAVWPRGFVYRTEGLTLEGSAARLGGEDLLWRVEGSPRVRATADSFELTAPRIGVGRAGGLVADGGVEAQLRNRGAGTLAVLFSGAEDVQVRSDSLVMEADDVLQFVGGARAWQGDQALVSERLTVSPSASFLRAEGDLLITVHPLVGGKAGPGSPGTGGESGASIPDPGEEDADDEAEGPQGSEAMRLVGERLLVEGRPPTIRLAGGAELRQGERRMGADSLTVAVAEGGGGWRTVDLVDDVELDDPAGTAVGTRLTYDLSSGDMTVHGSRDAPAVFTDSGGVRTESQEMLQLQWRETEVLIAAREQGRTRTVLVSRPDDDG